MDDKLNLQENGRQVHYDGGVCIVTLMLPYFAPRY